jgi:radical SAM superfamily enzyme YgiQ (UPF0313 family)
MLSNLLAGCDKEGIVLFNPPQFPPNNISRDIARKRGYSTYPPSGLYHLASAIHQVDHSLQIKIIDLHLEMVRLAAEGIEDIEQGLQEVVREQCKPFKKPLCGISCMFSTSEESCVLLSQWLREMHAVIVMGGVQATFDFENLLNKNIADIIVHYEAEETIQNLVKLWKENAAHEINSQEYTLRNVSFLTSEGSIMSFALGPKHVEPYPIVPYLKSVDVDSYTKYGSLSFLTKVLAPDEKFFALQSNRGCRGQCIFCSVRSFHGKGVIRRSVADVIDEIRFLHEVKGVTFLDWLDDDLFYDKKESIKLFHEMHRQFGNSVKWMTSNAVIIASIDEELLDAVIRSGCVHLGFGIETGNRERLKSIRKPASIDKTREVYAIVKSKYPDTYLMANFMIGFPNETFGELLETYAFALELENDWSRICITQPLRGTEMYSTFANLGDPRTLEGTGMSFTMGKEIQRHGRRGIFDFAYSTAIFEQPLDWELSLADIKELWYLLNANVNLVYNVNLTNRGNVKKFTAMASSIADMYPYDPIIWASLSEASKISGDYARAGEYYNKYLETRRLYPELADVFDRYNLERIFDLSERETRSLAFANNHELFELFGNVKPIQSK